MRDLDGMVAVIHSLFVLVDLGEEGADLHVSFALILEHFEP